MRRWWIGASVLGLLWATGEATAAPAWNLFRTEPPQATRALQNDLRPAVVVRLPARREFPLAVPPQATLELGLGVAADPGLADHVAPTRVRVALDAGDGPPRMLFERQLDPAQRPVDGRWFDLRIDLVPLAGVRGRLVIEAVPATNDPAASATMLLLSASRIVAGQPPTEPNVLLVTIDCLRADHVGAYGYTRPTTPSLDRLAGEGIRFAHAIANAPMTMPSVPQLYASRVFPQPADPTFLAALTEAGIPTAAIVNNAWITLWLAVIRNAVAEPLDRLVQADGWNAGRVTDAALSWIEGHPDDRWALHLHYLDAHSPYRLYPPAADRFGDPAYRGPVTADFDDQAGARHGRYDAEDQARVVSLYDAGIRYADDQIGRLLDRLRTTGLLDRTLVVVTADHGEELWDHGAFFHGQSLHDELLHVPLLLRLPGGAQAGTVVDAPVQLLDVAPSLLDWAGLPVPPGFSGRRLREVMTTPPPAPAFVVTATNPQFPVRYGVRTAERAFVEHLGAARRTLFDLLADPAERHDLPTAGTADATALDAVLDGARAPLRRRGFQVRVVAATPTRIALRLDDTREGRFTTLDRTGAFGRVRLGATRMGRGLRAKGIAASAPMGLRFDRRAPPFLAAAVPDRVRLSVTAAGKPVADADVALGAEGAAPRDGWIDTRDRRLIAATEPACPVPANGVRICVWRSPGDATDAAGPDDATRQRLHALGYAP